MHQLKNKQSSQLKINNQCQTFLKVKKKTLICTERKKRLNFWLEFHWECHLSYSHKMWPQTDIFYGNLKSYLQEMWASNEFTPKVNRIFTFSFILSRNCLIATSIIYASVKIHQWHACLSFAFYCHDM